MIVLISPAKSLDLDPAPIKKHTIPRMLAESEVLVNTLQKKSAGSLKKLMNISDKIAVLNVERYRNFSAPFTPDNAKQAVLAFNGDVYTGLQADTFDEADLDFAQRHLRILSGLYGLLKPLDLIQAYRLEMGTSLKRGRKKNLYEFWDTKITQLLNADLLEADSGTLVNLASKEYFRALKPSLLDGDVFHIDFKEKRNGQYKFISFNAKKARGVMARQIIKNRITDVKDLQSLDVDAYLFNDLMSDEQNLVFTKG